MRFVYGLNDFRDIDRAEENCYLLTNGIGGFSSLTIAGSNARNDQALLIGVSHSPNERYHLITNVHERLYIDNVEYDLASQKYVNFSNNQDGYRHLIGFTREYFPIWTYLVEGVRIKKTIAMPQGKNAVTVLYEIDNPTDKDVRLIATPLYQGVRKGDIYMEKQAVKAQLLSADAGEICTELSDWKIYEKSTGKIDINRSGVISDMYYAQDGRDGRDAYGRAFYNHVIDMDIVSGKSEHGIIFTASCEEKSAQSVKENVTTYIRAVMASEKQYIDDLVAKSGVKSDMAKELVRSADQYISHRDSTGGKTILAGFPFFGDWGRDTMIAMMGCTISVGRFDAAKSILRTFAKYCKDGLMPNIFPESGDEPLYNTVDAALLFFEALNQLWTATGDDAFIEEMYPVMTDIIEHYKAGTGYHIYMDEDSLISAGGGLEQVTWMDVRFEDILPTPRHGKPVEVNAYWYNALKIYAEASNMLEKTKAADMATSLSEKVKASFLEKFWNEEKKCLRDVISGNTYDEQVRCNQIWALSMSYTMPDAEQAKCILDTVRAELYTPYGLRSLSKKDEQFKAFYGGRQFDRDMAYHQGTVWGYPLGAYYLAKLRYAQDIESTKEEVKEELEYLESSIKEGCIGHIAEVFDGDRPTISKGCFAQAWSTGELLRVYAKIEQI